MARPHSNAPVLGEKQAKPYPDFPLCHHSSGYWVKRIRNKLHYFGPRWGDYKTALREYEAVRHDLEEGRTPRPASDEITTVELCNRFLESKDLQMQAGDLGARSFRDYKATCEKIVKQFGRQRLAIDLRPDDFQRFRTKMAKSWGPKTLSNEITRIRVVFRWGYENDLLEEPVKFGSDFRPPGKRKLREQRHKKGQRLFTADQIHALLSVASLQMKAMILLGINAGLGNRDCAKLEFGHVNLKTNWMDYPRPKTAIDRRAWLWPETITSLRAAKKDRRASKEDAHRNLWFVTKRGGSWYREDGTDDPIAKEFRKLLDATDIYRPGLSFYALRHTFETVAGETRDQISVNYIMGHVDPHISADYREAISDERLLEVSEFVRQWFIDGTA